MTPEDYKRQYEAFCNQEQQTQKRFDLRWDYRYPILGDDNIENPDYQYDYIYHVAWAARALRKINPHRHVDFSSSLYFTAMASAWFPVRFCDIRPPNLHLDNVTVQREDLRALSFADNSLSSVSCMHVIEHIGLGRYGDTLDYDGDLKAVNELKRVVRPGGDLLIVTPVGLKSAVCFNAHRVYAFPALIDMFADSCDVLEQVLIPENPADIGLLPNPTAEILSGQSYGCGCLWLRKR